MILKSYLKEISDVSKRYGFEIGVGVTEEETMRDNAATMIVKSVLVVKGITGSYPEYYDTAQNTEGNRIIDVRYHSIVRNTEQWVCNQCNYPNANDKFLTALGKAICPICASDDVNKSP